MRACECGRGSAKGSNGAQEAGFIASEGFARVREGPLTQVLCGRPTATAVISSDRAESMVLDLTAEQCSAELSFWAAPGADR